MADWDTQTIVRRWTESTHLPEDEEDRYIEQQWKPKLWQRQLESKLTAFPTLQPRNLLIWIQSKEPVGKTTFCRWFARKYRGLSARFQDNERSQEIVTVLEHLNERDRLQVILFDLPDHMLYKAETFKTLHDIGCGSLQGSFSRNTPKSRIQRTHIVCFARWAPTAVDLQEAGYNWEQVTVMNVSEEQHTVGPQTLTRIPIQNTEPDPRGEPPAIKRRPPVPGTTDDD